MAAYVHPDWRDRLARAGLSDFDALWQVEAGWFEDPNQRRGGWSGVSRYSLAEADGTTHDLFIKRQQNHPTFDLCHPLTGIPTFQREFKMIRKFMKLGIPTIVPVFFATRQAGKDQQAILVSEALTGFDSLDHLLVEWDASGFPPRERRLAFIASISNLLRRIHDAGMIHNSFSAKHLFLKTRDTGAVEVRVLDLEKCRWHPSRRHRAFRDLYSLILEARSVSRTDRLRFLLAYLGVARLNDEARALWRKIDAHARRKQRRLTR